MAWLIRCDSRIEYITPENGSDFTNEELHKYINGWVEVVWPGRLKRGHFMLEVTERATGKQTSTFIDIGSRTGYIVDEEGKLKGKPFNAIATLLYLFGRDDPIVGDVVMCEIGEEYR